MKFGRSIALASVLALMATLGVAREIPLSGGSIEIAFPPWDDAEGAVLRALNAAKHGVYVQAYLLTSRPLTRALISAKRRGVDVVVLTDREMVSKGDGKALRALGEAGVPVFVEVRYAIAHNKIILVDPDDADSAVITGSYNFTYAAHARNAENLLIIRANADVSRIYFDNWRRHRADAVPVADLPSAAIH